MTSQKENTPMLERVESSPAGVIPDASLDLNANRGEEIVIPANSGFSIAEDLRLL